MISARCVASSWPSRRSTSRPALSITITLLRPALSEKGGLPRVCRQSSRISIPTAGAIRPIAAREIPRAGAKSYALRSATATTDVVFADGHKMARCRMYRSTSEVWEGFTKNLYEGLGEHPLALTGALLLHLHSFVLPWLALALSGLLRSEPVLVGALLGVGANLLQRAWLSLRHRLPLEGIVLQPLGVLLLVALAIESFRRSTQGRISWRGRSYVARSERGA